MKTGETEHLLTAGAATHSEKLSPKLPSERKNAALLPSTVTSSKTAPAATFKAQDRGHIPFVGRNTIIQFSEVLRNETR